LDQPELPTMNQAEEIAQQPCSPLIERDDYDERNTILFLFLGMISIAETVLTAIPALAPAPSPQRISSKQANRSDSILR
jgi:hypothetical protein